MKTILLMMLIISGYTEEISQYWMIISRPYIADGFPHVETITQPITIKRNSNTMVLTNEKGIRVSNACRELIDQIVLNGDTNLKGHATRATETNELVAITMRVTIGEDKVIRGFGLVVVPMVGDAVDIILLPIDAAHGNGF